MTTAAPPSSPLDRLSLTATSGPIAPSADDTLEAGDELLIVAGRDSDPDDLHALLVTPRATT